MTFPMRYPICHRQERETVGASETVPGILRSNKAAATCDSRVWKDRLQDQGTFSNNRD